MSENEIVLKPLDKLLCSCLFDVIIDEKSDCMYELVRLNKPIKKFETNDLYYVKDLGNLLGREDYISERYARLAILTNEHLNLDSKIYFRVCRIIFNMEILNLNKLRDLTNISIWSNGSSNINKAEFLIYWKGIHLGYDDCPPSLTKILEVLHDFEYNKLSIIYIELHDLINDITNSELFTKVVNTQIDRQ